MDLPNEKYITEAVIEYSDTVFRVAFPYFGNRADAEDVVQEVFLQLCKSRPPYPPGSESLKAWLIRVTINKSKDALRAAKRRQTARLVSTPPPESHDEVFAALGRLSERDRNVLYLRYYEGYTAREIAGIIGGSERAVTKRICRAREKLKIFLEDNNE